MMIKIIAAALALCAMTTPSGAFSRDSTVTLVAVGAECGLPALVSRALAARAGSRRVSPQVVVAEVRDLVARERDRLRRSGEAPSACAWGREVLRRDAYGLSYH